MSSTKQPREKKKASLGFSILTVLVLIAFITLMLTVGKAPIVVVMILAWLVLVPFALYLGYSMHETEKFALDLIKPAIGVIALLIAVGGMVSIWLCAGTVPALIYWGLKIISPGAFLLVAFILTSIVALPTGTSWGTVATIGVAMMGVGLGLGLPAGVVAGAVISGAYFGNGFSPVSDAPLMQSSVLGIDIWDHIKFMAPTTGIAWLISAVLYGILGARYAGTSVDLASVNDMLASLESLFHINVVTLIPMAVVLVMMIMRYSALMCILCGSVVGIFVAVFMQGFSVAEVTGFMKSGFSVTCDNALISSLLNRGGFTSMYELVAIIVGSLGIGGILKGTGVLNVIIESLSKHIKSLAGLTITTFVASVITNAMVGTYYFCMTFVGTLMPELYKKQGYKPENPGRIINNVANCLVVFLPWNIGAQYMSSQTGVAIKDFAPFAFFPILIMLVDLIFGIFGIGAAKYTPEEMAQFAAEEAAVKAE